MDTLACVQAKYVVLGNNLQSEKMQQQLIDLRLECESNYLVSD